VNEAQRSDRFDLPKNMAFTFIIRIFGQFHAVTALRSRLNGSQPFAERLVGVSRQTVPLYSDGNWYCQPVCDPISIRTQEQSRLSPTRPFGERSPTQPVRLVSDGVYPVFYTPHTLNFGFLFLKQL
jgi:hypothetical protein